MGSTVQTAEIVKAVSDATGAPSRMVNAGGSCGVVMTTLEGGAVLGVTDLEGTFHCDAQVQSVWDGWFVAVYASEDAFWNGESPVREGESADESLSGLRSALGSALLAAE